MASKNKTAMLKFRLFNINTWIEDLEHGFETQNRDIKPEHPELGRPQILRNGCMRCYRAMAGRIEFTRTWLDLKK
jgi:hypothetical protein